MTPLPARHAEARRALEEGRSARIVGRARLRLGAEVSPQRARFLLEDALRTADFSDAGRLVAVRRLRLPRLPHDASPTLVSRQIERAWRAAAATALPGESPGAETAEAVYFAGPGAARIALVDRLLAGKVPQAWFWPRLVPDYPPGQPAPQALAALLAGCAPQDLALLAAALPHWPVRHRAALAAALPAHPPEGLDLAPAAPPTPPAPVSADVPDAAGAAVPAAPIEAIASSLAGSALPAGDWRLAWVAAAVLAAALPAAPPRVWRAAVGRVLARLRALRVAPEGPGAAATPAGVRPAAGPPRPPMTVPIPPEAPLPRLAPAAGPAPLQAATGPPPVTPAPLAEGLPPWLADAVATDCGGFLMLLNALADLGVAARLAAFSPVARRRVLRALLTDLARRCAMPDDDPHRPLLATRPEEADASIVAALRRDLRRHLRLERRIGIASLVRRPARLALSATHADVIFALADAELRLRRTGLDRDPGWLPWFGRIVGFHFVAAPHPERGHG